MICEGPVRGFAIRQEANWNKFSSCRVMSQFKRRSDTLGVSSDCAMPSTITSVWSRMHPLDREGLSPLADFSGAIILNAAIRDTLTHGFQT